MSGIRLMLIRTWIFCFIFRAPNLLYYSLNSSLTGGKVLETKTRYLLLILLFGGLLFLFNLGGRDLWDPDETRYAVIAREMVQDGNWILPHLNGQIYSEKPAFFFWLVNLSSFCLGENSELTNRLPSALAGLATVFITFLFGQRLFNLRTGFLSSLVLATCVLFPQVSRWMAFDSLFTLLFLLTLFCFYRGFEEEEGRRRDYLLAGFFTGLGVLTKGPIGYLPFLIILIFASFKRRPRNSGIGIFSSVFSFL